MRPGTTGALAMTSHSNLGHPTIPALKVV